MDYLLLLRGVNVGGKSRVPMAELRDQLTAANFTNVRSYINSGNLMVTSSLDQATCERVIAQVLGEQFAFEIPFRLVDKPTFIATLKQAPAWWGADPQLRHNALFKLSIYDTALDEWLTQHVTTDYDQILITPTVIFWTSTFKVNYSRSFYAKIAGTPFYKQTSARNYNTTMKLKQLLL